MAAEEPHADIGAPAGHIDDHASIEPATAHSTPFENAASLQPPWLRPTIALMVCAAHVAALFALSHAGPSAPPAEDTIEVNVIAAGDEAAVTTSSSQAAQAAAQSQPDPKPQQTEAPQDPAEPTPPQEAQPIVEQDPPPPPAPDPPKSLNTPPRAATSLEAAPPPPLQDTPPSPPATPPIVAMQDPASEPLPAQQPPTSIEEMQPLPSPPPPDKTRTQPQTRPKTQSRLEPAARPKLHKPDEATSSTSRSEASSTRLASAEGRHVGEATGQPVDAGRSRADYAAQVIAQIEAHRFYPESARARGEQGAVGVSFTIGPSGRVGSAAVVRSSGFAELDGAAREILHSISPPPPPGGSFSANTTIRFHFE
jgi:periplasmic protein TonB